MFQDEKDRQEADLEVDQDLVVHAKKGIDHDLEVRIKAGEELDQEKLSRLQEEKKSGERQVTHISTLGA